MALTVISPIYGSYASNGGVSINVPQASNTSSNFSAFGMPSSSPSSGGFSSPSSAGMTPPPPPPPIGAGTTPSRALHHQPSILRVGPITSPQPVGVKKNKTKTKKPKNKTKKKIICTVHEFFQLERAN